MLLDINITDLGALSLSSSNNRKHMRLFNYLYFMLILQKLYQVLFMHVYYIYISMYNYS